jgi:methylphosphotriester-DNA--protein-cysteine methyltransferase
MFVSAQAEEAAIAMNELDLSPDRARVAACVCRFLRNQGVQHRQQSRVVQEILGMSYSHSHRLVKGTVDWTLPQLIQLARYYEVTLAEVIAPLLGNPLPMSADKTK